MDGAALCDDALPWLRGISGLLERIGHLETLVFGTKRVHLLQVKSYLFIIPSV